MAAEYTDIQLTHIQSQICGTRSRLQLRFRVLLNEASLAVSAHDHLYESQLWRGRSSPGGNVCQQPMDNSDRVIPFSDSTRDWMEKISWVTNCGRPHCPWCSRWHGDRSDGQDGYPDLRLWSCLDVWCVRCDVLRICDGDCGKKGSTVSSRFVPDSGMAYSDVSICGSFRGDHKENTGDSGCRCRLVMGVGAETSRREEERRRGAALARCGP